MDACTTRLRLTVADQSAVDEAALRALGARGFVRPSAEALQVVLGPIADQVAGELRSALRDTKARDAVPAAARAAVSATTAPAGRPNEEIISRARAALGGDGNIAAIETASTRVLVSLREAASVDMDALRVLGLRGIARPAATSVHLVIGNDAAAFAERMRRPTEPRT